MIKLKFRILFFYPGRSSTSSLNTVGLAAAARSSQQQPERKEPRKTVVISEDPPTSAAASPRCAKPTN